MTSETIQKPLINPSNSKYGLTYSYDICTMAKINSNDVFKNDCKLVILGLFHPQELSCIFKIIIKWNSQINAKPN